MKYWAFIRFGTQHELLLRPDSTPVLHASLKAARAHRREWYGYTKKAWRNRPAIVRVEVREVTK
jgi:hypothetical protein